MRKLLFSFIILNSLISLAQNGPISFEPGEFGSTWSWTVFENIDNPPLEIVGNPDPSGINTSSRVAKFTALQGVRILAEKLVLVFPLAAIPECIPSRGALESRG